MRAALANSGVAVPPAARHRQPRAGIAAKDRTELRPGDRRGDRGRRRRAARGRHPGRRLRRAVALRRDQAGPRRAGDGARRARGTASGECSCRPRTPRRRRSPTASTSSAFRACRSCSTFCAATAQPEPADAGCASTTRCAGRPRSRRRARAGGRATRARDRCGGRPQPADGRAAGRRQDDARAPAAGDPAAADDGGGDRDHEGPGRRRPRSRRPGGGAAVPGAAPHDLAVGARSAGASRRSRARSRSPTTASSSSTSCPSSREPRSRRCASRSRRDRDGGPRPAGGHVPGARDARGGVQRLPVRAARAASARATTWTGSATPAASAGRCSTASTSSASSASRRRPSSSRTSVRRPRARREVRERVVAARRAAGGARARHPDRASRRRPREARLGHLSGRGQDRVLRLARTIADLAAQRGRRAGPSRGGARLPADRSAADRRVIDACDSCLRRSHRDAVEAAGSSTRLTRARHVEPRGRCGVCALRLLSRAAARPGSAAHGSLRDPHRVWSRRLDEPAAVVIGSRHPSEYGRTVAYRLGRGLGAAGVPVVSGLALGHRRDRPPRLPRRRRMHHRGARERRRRRVPAHEPAPVRADPRERVDRLRDAAGIASRCGGCSRPAIASWLRSGS